MDHILIHIDNALIPVGEIKCAVQNNDEFNNITGVRIEFKHGGHLKFPGLTLDDLELRIQAALNAAAPF